jgi:dephospho-CoA kinase
LCGGELCLCLSYGFILMSVDSEPEVQLERLMARDSSTKEEATSRVSSQMPISDKVKHATYTIDNNSTLEHVSEQVDIFLKIMNKKVSWFWFLHWLIPPLGLTAAGWTLLKKILVERLKSWTST